MLVLFLFLNLVKLHAAEKTTIAENSGLRDVFLNANSIISLTSPLNAGSSEVLEQQSDFLLLLRGSSCDQAQTVGVLRAQLVRRWPCYRDIPVSAKQRSGENKATS